MRRREQPRAGNKLRTDLSWDLVAPSGEGTTNAWHDNCPPGGSVSRAVDHCERSAHTACMCGLRGTEQHLDLQHICGWGQLGRGSRRGWWTGSWSAGSPDRATQLDFCALCNDIHSRVHAKLFAQKAITPSVVQPSLVSTAECAFMQAMHALLSDCTAPQALCISTAHSFLTGHTLSGGTGGVSTGQVAAGWLQEAHACTFGYSAAAL
jgi:hypothetical protein